jgi:hypothetical protein
MKCLMIALWCIAALIVAAWIGSDAYEKSATQKTNDDSAQLARATTTLRYERMQRDVDEYAQKVRRIEAENAAQERFNATRLKIMDARLAADLAKIDLEEAMELHRQLTNRIQKSGF